MNGSVGIKIDNCTDVVMTGNRILGFAIGIDIVDSKNVEVDSTVFADVINPVRAVRVEGLVARNNRHLSDSHVRTDWPAGLRTELTVAAKLVQAYIASIR